MIERLELLIELLREELQHYGELLALLDQQGELVVGTSSQDAAQATVAIHDRAGIICTARQNRQTCQRQLARLLGQPEDKPLAEMIGLIPAAYSPLVQALVEENNQLLLRVQQRARQNHLLLTRSAESMQRFVCRLAPGQGGAVEPRQGLLDETRLAGRTC